MELVTVSPILGPLSLCFLQVLILKQLGIDVSLLE